ncbi:hypothetical protein HMPREF1548_00324 [Clostridium sp. KLE 1755]|nr:hypothetical protein HMPREF1548_00324 [Clostridium sp. KLE 1755]
MAFCIKKWYNIKDMCVGGPGPRFYMKKFIDAGGKNLQPGLSQSLFEDSFS